MEVRLEARVPGGVSDVCKAAETSVEAKRSIALKTVCTERLVPSEREACAGGMFESEECTLQQERSGIAIDDPQSCVIWRQQAWCGAGVKQAKPGSAAHSTMIASMNQAPFLPTRKVYTCPRFEYAVFVP